MLQTQDAARTQQNSTPPRTTSTPLGKTRSVPRTTSILMKITSTLPRTRSTQRSTSLPEAGWNGLGLTDSPFNMLKSTSMDLQSLLIVGLGQCKHLTGLVFTSLCNHFHWAHRWECSSSTILQFNRRRFYFSQQPSSWTSKQWIKCSQVQLDERWRMFVAWQGRTCSSSLLMNSALLIWWSTASGCTSLSSSMPRQNAGKWRWANPCALLLAVSSHLRKIPVHSGHTESSQFQLVHRTSEDGNLPIPVSESSWPPAWCFVILALPAETVKECHGEKKRSSSHSRNVLRIQAAPTSSWNVLQEYKLHLRQSCPMLKHSGNWPNCWN